MKFKIGDNVKWESQASGVVKTKKGEVVGVIPKGKIVGHVLSKKKFEKYVNVTKNITTKDTAREHESYLVAVDKNRLYWPKVTHLKASR